MAVSLPNPQHQQQQKFNLTFRKPDRIQVISNCGDGPMRLAEQTVLNCYSPGLTSVKAKKQQPDQAWTLKLSHSPFARGSPSNDAIAARELACDLLLASWRAGWALVAAPIVTNVRDVATWFFQRRPDADPLVGADTDAQNFYCCCLMLTQSNGLRFVRFPPVLTERVAELVASMWPAGVQCAGSELRLSGCPWTAQKADGASARRLLLRLVELMQRNGWQLLTSARIKDSSDSLYFCHRDGGCDDIFSDHPSALSLQQAQLMLISLHDKQSVRMEGGDPDTDSTWLANALNRLWHRGVQSHGNYYGAVDIRLGGSPWLPTDKNSKNLCRQLICRLLGELRTRGWRVLHSLDIYRRYPVIKSAFLFARTAPEPEPVRHCCFWTGVSNRLSFIDVPEGLLESSIAVANACGNVASQKAREHAYELKFRGQACNKLDWRILLTNLLGEFTTNGWRLACTGNVSGRFYSDDSTSYSLEVHSWWFAWPGSAERKELEAAVSATAFTTAELASFSEPDGSAQLPQMPPSYDSLFGPPPV
uniref:RNase H domain-containing protein n=1 Tax=Macrostomum lignano TaxID=282301 RepID=A0A1I8HE91_9PLAT